MFSSRVGFRMIIYINKENKERQYRLINFMDYTKKFITSKNLDTGNDLYIKSTFILDTIKGKSIYTNGNVNELQYDAINERDSWFWKHFIPLLFEEN